MKTKKLKVKLYPDQGRIIRGAFVFVNGQITIAENVTTTTIEVKLGNELIEFPKIAVHLAKYFCFSNNHKIIGELSYKDYDKVKDNDVIIGEIFPKSTPVEIGDKVRINRPSLHDLEKCIRCQYEGVVVKATSRLFTIALPDTEIECYRHQFQLINKPNFRNIIKYIKTI